MHHQRSLSGMPSPHQYRELRIVLNQAIESSEFGYFFLAITETS